LNSTVRCLLHNSQPYGHTLSYYLSYNLKSPNIYPCVTNTVPFLPSSFAVIILDKFLIPGMCSTCFTHSSHSTNNIINVTYDKCCRLTSVSLSSQMTARHCSIRSYTDSPLSSPQ
jgi:hypothetical protein